MIQAKPGLLKGLKNSSSLEAQPVRGGYTLKEPPVDVLTLPDESEDKAFSHPNNYFYL